MRRHGVIRRWDDNKGFGFIRPDDGGSDVFVHVSACQLRHLERPTPGTLVSFEVVHEQGRLGASAVLPQHGWSSVDELPAGAVEQRRRTREEMRTHPRPRPSPQGRSQGHGSVSLLAAGCLVILVALLVWGTRLQRLPDGLWLWYAGASLVCFSLYARDKSAARRRQWRTPETTLLGAGLIGGWPGAIVAQHLLRHKSVKAEFRMVFHATVLMNLMALAVLAWKGSAIF
jgi:uncharacterized membrane protein YsdA (DUF1294 family)/cold shock CspA family protein